MVKKTLKEEKAFPKELKKENKINEIDDIFSKPKPSLSQITKMNTLLNAKPSKSVKYTSKTDIKSLKRSILNEPISSIEATETVSLESSESLESLESPDTFESISLKIKLAKSQPKIFHSSDLIGTRFQAVSTDNKPKQNQKDAFNDSRGTLSTNRKTEDGLRLFDIKDLNIGVGEGGNYHKLHFVIIRFCIMSIRLYLLFLKKKMNPS